MELRVNKISEVAEVQLEALGFKCSGYFGFDETWYKDYESGFSIILNPISHGKPINSVHVGYSNEIEIQDGEDGVSVDDSVSITDMYVDLILLMKYGIIVEGK